MGNFAACAVLDDGAGISYGISQFTHASGALLAVVKRYLDNGGKVGAAAMLSRMETLRDRSGAAVRRFAADGEFKAALIAAAATSEMRAAQVDTSEALYLEPAIEICGRYGFVLPLSLAVVYDSIVHGSFNRVARTVNVGKHDERTWIAAYVRRRDHWLQSYVRLAKTRYRTRFFLGQIANGNWQLALPLSVNGVKLGAVADDFAKPAMADASPAASAPTSVTTKTVIDETRRIAEKAASQFDRVESVVTAVTTRADAAKSMWTTIGGTLWQAAWATFGFFAGLPTTVWITVAAIAALLMLAYLYRQITLGRIRELSTLTKEQI